MEGLCQDWMTCSVVSMSQQRILLTGVKQSTNWPIMKEKMRYVSCPR